MALALVARRDGGWGGYASFRRRAARLGHIAAVMLPVIAGFYAVAIDRHGADERLATWGAWLWVAGGVALPIALWIVAWSRRLQTVLVLPASALALAAFALSLAHLHS
jgi:hypothetical protein